MLKQWRMTKANINSSLTPPELAVTPSIAARTLSAGLGESEAVWTTRLANWRRPGRKGPIQQQENPTGKPSYTFAEIHAYIERTLTERAASTPPHADRDTLRVTAVPELGAEVPFVRVIWNSGAAQGGINIRPATAKHLATELRQAAARAEQIQGERLL